MFANNNGTETRQHLLPSVPLSVPYGAHPAKKGVQFTLFSRHASRVWLMLFNDPNASTPDEEYELTPEKNRIGDIWHIHLQTAREGQFYAYRMEGKAPPGEVNFFNPNQWLLDPYALAISGSPTWADPFNLQPGKPPKNGPLFPKGVIVRNEFDWEEDKTPRIPLAETIIYETHLRGFTVHPSAGSKHPGTYRGLMDKIPYLRDLGITAVELLPIQEFNEMEYYLENTGRKNLRNYWGYSTLAFFAPNGRYAHKGVYGSQVREFKELVIALHKAGLEVILDVVFNHTAEAGDGGPIYSFRGIDNSVFYIMDEKGHYKNYSGCGNTVNSNTPIVRDFIMDCLRYWVLHMHVDGFRFDLASILTRGPDGEVLPAPPIVEQIAEDPALRDTKIIAEAWDAAGSYQVGTFPSDRWSEWNGLYRDDVRRFWLSGKPGTMGRMATRLSGSSDLYDRNGQTPLKSINFITCHDGFTLADLTYYNQKHNEANGESNRDGETNNWGNNHGVEGPTSDTNILAIRKRQQKNLVATLFLSQGVPMMLAGDEFGRTQQGNNNAYCQDNEISWVDWSLLDKHADLQQFTKKMIAFRKAHPSLRRARFFAGDKKGQPVDIQWIGPNGSAPDWVNGLTFGALLYGARNLTGADKDDDTILILLNASEQSVQFNLPRAPNKAWTLEIFTSENEPAWLRDRNALEMIPRSLAVLVSSL